MIRTNGTARAALDSVDADIVRLLRQDGRTSNVELGRRFHLSEAAVRKRIARLLREGYIRIVAVENPRRLGLATRAYIGLRLELPQIKSVADQVCRLPEAQVVLYSTGAYDLMVEVLLPSNEALHRFVTETLAAIPGIKTTETTVIPKILKSRFEFTDDGSGELGHSSGSNAVTQVNFDSFDADIVRLLRQDGRTSNVEIGRRLHLSEAAVRKRIARLLREGYIRIVAIENVRKLGFATRALIGLRVDLSQQKRVAEQVVRLPEAQYVVYSTGAYDLMIDGVLVSNEALHPFVTETLAAIPGINRVETTVVRIAKTNYEFTDDVDWDRSSGAGAVTGDEVAAGQASAHETAAEEGLPTS